MCGVPCRTNNEWRVQLSGVLSPRCSYFSLCRVTLASASASLVHTRMIVLTCFLLFCCRADKQSPSSVQMKSQICLYIIHKLLPAKVNQIATRLPGHYIAALYAASQTAAPYAVCDVNSKAINSTGLGHGGTACLGCSELASRPTRP